MKNTSTFTGLMAGLLFLALPGASSALDLGVSFSTFATPDRPYVEINLAIAGLSIKYVPVPGDTTRLHASADVLIMIKRGEEVVNFDKYTLNSPSVGFPRDLLDVRRLFVANGKYTLEITAQDVNMVTNKKTYTYPIEVNIMDGLHLADMQLLHSFHADPGEGPFVKNGYFLEPQPFGFYNRTDTTLSFYSEIYHADKVITDGSSYLVRYFIEEEGAPGEKKATLSIGKLRKKPAPIDAILVQMDIRNLNSGNYVLTVEVRSNTNELLTQKSVHFQRSNPFKDMQASQMSDDLLAKQFVQQLDEKALRFSLRAVGSVAGSEDAETIKNILKSGDPKPMRFFLFRYFAEMNPNVPELAFKEFIDRANFAAETYKSGFRYGFETDRGRTYMRFGKPNDIVHVEDDPSAAPYEIWIYYTFPKTRQQNVKFLFYNPSLAGEDFVLLHSNAHGEINNPSWERDLYKRNAGEQYDGANYQDATTMQRNVNRNARAYFEDF
jgi:GWxTD domain-containing protein